METDAHRLLEEAISTLDSSTEELNRPSADAVSYIICQKSKGTLGKLLSSFLIENGQTPELSDSPAQLIAKCIAIDPSFKSLPVTELSRCYNEACHDASIYCLSLDKAKECLAVAKQTRELVESKLSRGLMD